ncbi:MAG: hypothetical protein K2O62_04870, partial [Clostridia bacterium]|nr:hypothetical protein [Clostridia bacterium]
IKDINKVGSALFIESSRTDGCYGKDDNYYCLTTPDALYEKEVVLSDNRDLHFIFDGVSTLWKKDGDQLVKAYTYAITGDNEVVLTDITTMKKYKGTIINSGMYTYLTIVEI